MLALKIQQKQVTYVDSRYLTRVAPTCVHQGKEREIDSETK